MDKGLVLLAMRYMLTIGEKHPLYAILADAIGYSLLTNEELEALAAEAKPF